jgi:pimeloyl-ACP methyl ester carboxylesterase
MFRIALEKQMNRYPLFLVWVFFLFGCANHPVEQPQHVVMVQPEGWLQDTNGKPATDQRAVDACLKPVYDGILKNKDDTNAAPASRTNILIFIQGGLNSINDGIDRANTLSDEILHDTHSGAGFYPIFLAWDSRLPQSWEDHLVVVKGVRHDKWWAWFTVAGYNVAADVGRAGGRVALTLWYTWLNQHRARQDMIRPFDFDQEAHGNQRAYTNLYAECKALQDKGVEVKCDGSPKIPVGRYIESEAFIIPQLAGSLVVDTGGKAGWDQMVRRTLTMYVPSIDELKRGAVDDFANGLSALLRTNTDIKVTIVGHSMGTIVANEILREHFRDLHIVNVVYMGAACSVEDFGKSVVPFLTANPSVHFYNLSLHPTNERAEDHPQAYYLFEPICPHGSLPQWINDYYSYLADLEPSGAPLGAFELGIPQVDRWISVGPTIESKNHLYHQLSFNCFSLGSKKYDGPQRHGDFSTVRFWDPQLWNDCWKQRLDNQHTDSTSALH